MKHMLRAKNIHYRQWLDRAGAHVTCFIATYDNNWLFLDGISPFTVAISSLFSLPNGMVLCNLC